MTLNTRPFNSVRNILMGAAGMFALGRLTTPQQSLAQSTATAKNMESKPAATAVTESAAAPSSLQHGHRLDLKAAFLMNIDMPMTFADAIAIPLFLGGERPNPSARLRSLTAVKGSPVQLISPADGMAFETWVEDSSSDYVESFRAGSGEIERGPGWVTIPRSLRDDIRHVSVSYTVSAERILELPRQDPPRYRITFGDFDDKDPQLQVTVDSDSISAGRYPAPQLAQDGDVIALELYRDSKTGRKVVDYIHIGKLNSMTLRTDAPHESYASDAEFTLSHPRLRINGEKQDSVPLPETLRGPDVWVYVPGHGRYVASFQQHFRFDRIGEVTGQILTFMEGADVIKIDCAERIAAGSGSYRIHLLRDSVWTPADAKDRGNVVIGAMPGVQ